ncbi:hypothetical protein D9615_002585 [Tricholomella constricta]|uniref:Glucose receptor Git3 N-terminal domain-containing protein n=1 Tax=Tricholomella constricta TaxID=117010 RepID=A0A8H5HLY9_9AGAR|nr:hypothetical protein D9615_002585 [Tricholomella constricta]
MGDIAVPPGIICTAEQYSRMLSGDASIHCLTRTESIGLTVVTEIGLVSLFAVCYVFFIIARNVIQHIRHTPDGKISIVQEPMDIFMASPCRFDIYVHLVYQTLHALQLSLFIADFIQALGAVMDIKWIHEGKVEIGNFCTAQGVIQQLGETGVAITTLLIAIYTFIGVWWRIGMGQKSVRVAKIIIGLVWSFVFLMIVLGNAIHADKSKLYQSPTPYWCWIGNEYLQWRIWGEYVWFWITLAFSSFAYTLLFFWSRGNITLDEYSWWKFSIHRASKFDAHQTTRMQSLVMLAYPIVYSVLIMPLSIVRWIGFVQERGDGVNTIGAAPVMLVIGIYGLSGAANVVLLLTTRPNSVLFGHPVDYTPRVSRPSASMSTNAPLTMYKTNSVSEMEGEPSNDLGRLPSRSSAGWP